MESQLFFDRSAPQYPTGNDPKAAALGDFNGDGKLDLAVATDLSVSVLLNNGDGTFQMNVEYATGAQTSPSLYEFGPAIAVGDFNGDGKADLAVTNLLENSVSVLLGNGDGTFQTHVDYSVMTQPSSVAVADFNGDGKQDLAVTNSYDYSFSVLLGNGNGTFQPAANSAYSAAGSGPAFVAVGDFNSDGKADLAVADYYEDSVSVLLGNGDGTFQTRVVYATASHPFSVAIGDFNADERADLVLSSSFGPSVSVLLGNGDGTFQPHVDYTTGHDANSVVVGDFNGDGRADLAAINNYDNSVSILLGNGDGTFQTHMDYATGRSPWAVAVGDVNGDGRQDLVVTNVSDDSVSILLGEDDGTFRTLPYYATGNQPSSIAAGDFNGDGKPDLAIANISDNSISILLGNGDGTFQTRVDYAAGKNPYSVAVGDFNGDGKQDLAVTNHSDNSVSILLGQGDGTFQPHKEYATGAGPYSVAVGDLNGDGKPDLVVVCYLDVKWPVHGHSVSGTISVLLGTGDGTFQSAASYSYSGSNSPAALALDDFNGDGILDLAVANPAFYDFYFTIYESGSIGMLLGNGDGTFQTEVPYPCCGSTPLLLLSPSSVAVGDFNGDGKADLAVRGTLLADSLAIPTQEVGVLLGNGDGTFSTGVSYQVTGVGELYVRPPGFSVAVGDFNADGKPDLAMTGGNDTNVNVLLGNGDGTFQIGRDYASGHGYGAVTVADFNSDGALDLAFLPRGNAVSVLLNLRGTILELRSSPNPSGGGQSVTLTATIQPSLSDVGLAAPTGTVAFMEGTNELGRQTLGADGVVTLAIDALTLGTHSIAAVYSGDANFNPHTALVTQVVKPPDFGLGAAPGNTTIKSGSAAMVSITSTAMYGFEGSLSLSCSVSPKPTLAPTCALTPSTITLPLNGSASSQLSITTVGSSASMGPRLQEGWRLVYTAWLFLPSLAVLTIGSGKLRSKTKKVFGGVVLGFVLAGGALYSACGGGGSRIASTSTSGTPAGQYQVTVNAISGSITHTTQVTLTVQ